MLINIENLSFSYGVHEIFNHVNLTVGEKEAIGLVGRNGTGKSTLLKLITGELRPDSGQIIHKNGLSLGYLAQAPDYDEALTIRQLFYSVFDHLAAMEKKLRAMEETIAEHHGAADEDKLMTSYGDLQEKYGELGGYEYPSRIRGIAVGLGFSDAELDKPFSVLSGGEKTRVSLGMNLLGEPELLLLDEPTNYLDIASLSWLEQFLRGYNGAFMVISHDRYFLDRVAGRIVEVIDKGLKSYEGNYTTYADRKEKELMDLNHQYAQQMKEIKRQEAIIARFRRYNSLHSSKRAASREKALAKVDRLDAVKSENEIHFDFKPKIRSGDEVLDATGLAKSYGDQELFHDVSFNVQRGDKIGIIGPNGIGKSTLFRIIRDQVSPDAGDIRFGHKVNVGFFDQESRDLRAMRTKNLIDALWDVDSHYTEGELRNILAAFLFTGDEVFKEIGSLSGGETARIALARLMLGKANFLLLDEPTNHIDMGTKEILENALIAYQGTLLFISHDRYFLNRVATQIFDFKQDGIVPYLGNYDDYQKSVDEAKLRSELAARENIVSPTKTQIKADRKKTKAREAELRAMKKEIAATENSIEKLEASLMDYEDQMCAEDFYNDPEQVRTVTTAYEVAKAEIETLTERWEEQTLLYEEAETE